MSCDDDDDDCNISQSVLTDCYCVSNIRVGDTPTFPILSIILVCVIFIFKITKKKYSIYTVFITGSTNLLLTSGTRVRACV